VTPSWVRRWHLFGDTDRFAVVGQEGDQIGGIAHDPVLHPVMEAIDNFAGALFKVQPQEVWFYDQAIFLLLREKLGHGFSGHASGIVATGKHASEAIAPVAALAELYLSKVLGLFEEQFPVWLGVGARFKAAGQAGADGGE